MQTPLARLRLVALIGLLVIATGTFGYRITGQSWVDSLYQTMMTITTVGFHENRELTQNERIFTMVIMVTGIGTVAYLFTLGVQLIVEGEISEAVGRRRMDKQIARMQGHIVLCGWGRVGRAVGEDLAVGGRPFVVVDTNADKLAQADTDAPTLVGDATSTSVLRDAGVERAAALVVVLSGDAENLLATLTARDLAPDIFVVARAREDETIDKLTNAGADRVINPDSLGAARMSSFIVQPSVAEFVDMLMYDADLDLELRETMIPPESPFVGQAFGDCAPIETAGVVVLAIRDVDGVYYTNPDPDMVLQPGQFIIGIGTDRQHVRLNGTLITGKESI